MNVTREVITDLLPVYTSGEASAETVSLVDEFLRNDPEFAELIRDEGTPHTLTPFPVTVSPDLERRSLNLTKKRLRIRGVLLGLAIFFSVFPLSSYGNSEEGLQWLMLRDAPATAGVSLVLGVGFWISYFLQGRRLRT